MCGSVGGIFVLASCGVGVCLSGLSGAWVSPGVRRNQIQFLIFFALLRGDPLQKDESETGNLAIHIDGRVAFFLWKSGKKLRPPFLRTKETEVGHFVSRFRRICRDLVSKKKEANCRIVRQFADRFWTFFVPIRSWQIGRCNKVCKWRLGCGSEGRPNSRFVREDSSPPEFKSAIFHVAQYRAKKIVHKLSKSG